MGFYILRTRRVSYIWYCVISTSLWRLNYIILQSIINYTADMSISAINGTMQYLQTSNRLDACIIKNENLSYLWLKFPWLWNRFNLH